MKRTKDLVNEMSEFESFILSEIKQAVEKPKIKYYTEEDLKCAYMEGGDYETKYKTFYEWFEQFKNK